MLVGSFNVAPFSASQDGKRDTSAAASFDISLFDEQAKDRAKPAAADAASERRATQRANEAIAREFMEWQQKSPAEKIRERVLGAHNLDEDSLKNLPPAERKAIEDEIRAAIQQAFGADDEGGVERETLAENATAAL